MLHEFLTFAGEHPFLAVIFACVAGGAVRSACIMIIAICKRG